MYNSIVTPYHHPYMAAWSTWEYSPYSQITQLRQPVWECFQPLTCTCSPSLTQVVQHRNKLFAHSVLVHVPVKHTEQLTCIYRQGTRRTYCGSGFSWDCSLSSMRWESTHYLTDNVLKENGNFLQKHGFRLSKHAIDEKDNSYIFHAPTNLCTVYMESLHYNTVLIWETENFLYQHATVTSTNLLFTTAHLCMYKHKHTHTHTHTHTMYLSHLGNVSFTGEAIRAHEEHVLGCL